MKPSLLRFLAAAARLLACCCLPVPSHRHQDSLAAWLRVGDTPVQP